MLKLLGVPGPALSLDWRDEAGGEYAAQSLGFALDGYRLEQLFEDGWQTGAVWSEDLGYWVEKDGERKVNLPEIGRWGHKLPVPETIMVEIWGDHLLYAEEMKGPFSFTWNHKVARLELRQLVRHGQEHWQPPHYIHRAYARGAKDGRWVASASWPEARGAAGRLVFTVPAWERPESPFTVPARERLSPLAACRDR